MDISAEIAAIQAASQGSELRQPLVGALNKLNSGSLPAVTASDVGKILKVGANGWEVGEKSGYMPVPTDTKQIAENGTYDVTNYASAVVIVSGGGSSNILSGDIAPSDSIGSNGQLYLRSFSLPTDATFVEYLQSDGTQYINTGIKATQNTDVKAKFQNITGTHGAVFGARTGSSSQETKTLRGSCVNTNAYFIKNGIVNLSATDFAYTITSGSIVEIESSTLNSGSNYHAVLALNNNYKSRDFTSFTADYNQILFGFYNNGNLSKEPCRIYRITYFESGLPIADYLPCLDPNGIPCMWNSVAKQYAYNDGAGNFVYGNSIVPDALKPVLYVKINGAWHSLNKSNTNNIIV